MLKKILPLLPMQVFISLFLSTPCHQNYFETVIETTHKIYYFILEFHNTKLYIISLVVYMLK
jgi:hypothetical protein